MKNKKPRARAESSSNPDKNPGRLPAKGGVSRGLAFSVIIFAIAVSAAVWFGFGNSGKRGTEAYVPRPRGAVTFNKDVAPIIFNHCAGCHRPGQAAPFELLSYGDVRKHAKQIMEVTGRRYMPPWLPEPECGEFADSRRLTAEQIGTIRQWVTEGAVEGAASDLPPRPRWTEGWQLGEPDLVVTMPQPYTLPAEGRDVYRNFVIPIPLPDARYVRAVEFRPGNWKVVHHAFLKLDATRDSRLRDEADPEPGFDGIHAPPNAQPPSGHFLSWQPGKVVSAGNDGLAWRLEKDTDLVLQMHLRPSGKPEQLQSSVGFYFTDRAPTNTPIKTWMNSYTIDIPAGKKDYVLEQSYTLPCDVDALGVLPHAHYLGKELQAWAMLPDGAKQWLICIKDWDFNWQGDYRYAHPVFLPKGTVIQMRYTYDNSAGNPRNPHQPPERVQYGLQSNDEMGELWLQLLPRDAAGLEALRRDNESRILENSVAYN
ncbi:MAG TPA: cytochrome c, partial [Candidatus Nitrosotalea sp.]|nr:cytochrome c [Candidatus Nitrosotalea sp.]